MEALQKKGTELLRWSEKYTKTDMVYLFNSMGWVFLGQIFTTITALVVLIVLANVLSKEVLGEYRLVVSACLMLIAFALPGMNVALPQSIAKKHSGDLYLATRNRILWGALGSIPAIGIGMYYLYTQNFTLGVSFLLVSLLIPFFNSFFSFYPYFQGKKEFKKSALLHAAGRLVFAIGILTVAFITPATIALTAVFLVLTIGTQFFAYRYAKKDESQHEKKHDPDLIPYAKYLTLVGTPSFLAGNFDKFIIGFFLGPVQLALYFVATTFAMESSRIGRILAQAILPKLSEKIEIDITSFFKKILLLEGLLIIGWIIYALLAPVLFSIFFPAYTEVVGLSVLAMLAMLFAPIYVIRSLFIAQKRKDDLRLMLVYSPVIQMLTVVCGIILYGLVGAVVGMLLGLGIELTIGIFLLVRRST